MLKDILPVAVITEINSSTLKSAKRFQVASPICHVTVTVEGIDTIHEVVAEKSIPLTPQHTLRAKSNGLDGGGDYTINDGPSVSVESGESLVLGLYLKDEEVGSFRITGW